MSTVRPEKVATPLTALTVSVPPNVALYLLNQKRHTLSEIEKRYGFAVLIEADRNIPVELVENGAQFLLCKIVSCKGQPGGHHAAADVHAYGSRYDRAHRRDHRAHRGADAQVDIGHRGDVVMHDRQA